MTPANAVTLAIGAAIAGAVAVLVARRLGIELAPAELVDELQADDDGT
jgi:hypothetical protein